MSGMLMHFALEKATKNTYRYREVEVGTDKDVEVPIVGTLYVQKFALPSKPQRLQVAIQVVDGTREVVAS